MALSKGNNRGSAGVSDLLSPSTERRGKRIQMSIDPSAMGKIMDRLTDLYTDPIVATVRETISNALDATAVARASGAHPSPVKITLPNQFEPEFVISDNGVGMSAENIENVVAKYGGSLKEDNFNQVGSYGLGIKSPLAYCDEFYFTTTKNGETCEVAISRFDSGPQTEILSIVDSGAEPGTTVRVPVKNFASDFESFRNAVDMYRNYAFTMNESIIIDDVEYSENSNFFQFDDIEIESEEKITGRVWLNKNQLSNIVGMLNSTAVRNIRLSVSYVLSGFVYKDPAQVDYYRSESDLIVELKPGILNFSSSRDEITKDSRFDFFNKLVKSQIIDPTYLFGNLLKYYKSITDNTIAYSVLQSYEGVISEDKITFEKKLKDYDKKANIIPMSYEVDIQELTTITGYNHLLENRDNKNSASFLGAVVVDCYNNSKVSAIDVPRGNNKNYNSLAKTLRTEGSLISETKYLLKDNLHSTSVAPILESTDLFVKKMSNLLNTNNVQDNSVYVIDNVSTEKEIDSIIRNRNVIDGVRGYVFVKETLNNNQKTAISTRFSAFTKMKVVFQTVSSFDEAVKEVRKARAATRRAVDKNAPFTMEGRIVEPLSSVEEIYNINVTGYERSVKVNINEYNDLNALFVVVKHVNDVDVANTVNGAYSNDGEDVFNRPIVVVKDPVKRFFEIVKDSSSYAVSKNYDARSALAKEKIEGRVFNRSVVQDRISAFSDEFRFAVHFLNNTYRLTTERYVSLYIKLKNNNTVNPIERDMAKIQEVANYSDYTPYLTQIADFLYHVGNQKFEAYSINPYTHVGDSILDGIPTYKIKEYKHNVNIFNIIVTGLPYTHTKKEKELSKMKDAFEATDDENMKKIISNHMESVVKHLKQVSEESDDDE